MYFSPSAVLQVVLDVQQRAQIVTDVLAVLDRDRAWGPTPERGRRRRASLRGAAVAGTRSKITRNTQPIDSRRNCRSKISSP